WVRTRTGSYQLPPALRVLRLQRFPVVVFIVAWVLVVSTIDRGGYHDIRRGPATGLAAPPTLGAAWNQWVRANGTGGSGVPPGVMVAAQGGGLRAAVWTALVMECLFGPGPVRDSGPGVCAGGSQPPDRGALASGVQAPTPLFLASGASGGSLGI